MALYLKKKKKARSWRYPVETVRDADYVDNLTFLANTTAQSESLLQSLEWQAPKSQSYKE